MHFRQILNQDLGCASYLLADEGDAVVIDPKWEIDEYLSAAREAGVEIRLVLETHTHADHVSGRRRLAAATGATIHLPADPADPEGPGLRAGDVIRVGTVELLVLTAPGHRPEHLAFLVRVDGGRATALLSGDSLLVGDVARPDLAVGAEAGARAMWDTLQGLGRLNEEIELWPAHVGGSLCASSSASAETSSTIGAERRRNRMLAFRDLPSFSAELRRCIPPRPPRAEQVVALNRRGAEEPGPIRELDPAALRCIGVGRLCVIDVRDPDEFDAGHLAGSVNLPVRGQGVGVRAGWVARPDEPIVLVAPSRERGCEAAGLLRSAGVWNLAGLSVADLSGWGVAELEVSSTVALMPDRVALDFQAGKLELIDVRDTAEWASGNIAGSRSLPLSDLGNGRQVDLGSDGPVAVTCATGVRAAVAASLLRRRGHRTVSRVTGGVDQLAELGLPLIRDAA